MLEVLRKALIDHSPVDMIYMTENGVITQRIINVNELTEQTVKGFCHLRKRTRTFKLENILAVLPCHLQKKYVS